VVHCFSGSVFQLENHQHLRALCARKEACYGREIARHTKPVSSYVSHSDYYNPIGGGNTSEACVKEVSARTERRSKQTRGILSELHYKTLLWIAERAAAERGRTNPTFHR